MEKKKKKEKKVTDIISSLRAPICGATANRWCVGVL